MIPGNEIKRCKRCRKPTRSIILSRRGRCVECEIYYLRVEMKLEQNNNEKLINV
jgi:hypothetical protein